METDAVLRRVERTAIAVCGATAVAALILTRGAVGAAAAVAAGGMLIGVSYWAIKTGVSELLQAVALRGAAGAPVPRRSIVLKLAGRYALLALLAYVMIARLRLHPLGLLAGASSVTAAVSIEALRSLLKKNP